MPDPPVDIFALLNELADRYRRLQAAADADTVSEQDKQDAKRCKEIAIRLRQLTSDNLADGRKLESWFDVLQDSDQNKRRRARAVIAQSVSFGEAVQLGEFFENVSESLITAQQALNRKSLEYVADVIRTDPRLPPAYFAIPSVKAEMKMGFSRVSKRGVNVVLFSSSQQKQEYGESTVTFELVAAPPPPGPPNYGGYRVPVPRFVVLGGKRAEILESLRTLQSALNLSTDSYKNGEIFALVLAYEPKPDSTAQEYLVLWPSLTKKRLEKKPENWSEFAVFHIRDDGTVKITAEIYDGTRVPPNSILHLPPTGTVDSWTPKDKTNRIVNLGDVLMNVIFVLDGWLKAMEVPPPSLPAGPGTANG